VRPRSQCPHSCICERFIFPRPRSFISGNICLTFSVQSTVLYYASNLLCWPPFYLKITYILPLTLLLSFTSLPSTNFILISRFLLVSLFSPLQFLIFLLQYLLQYIFFPFSLLPLPPHIQYSGTSFIKS
jgi:hypothetical protein